MQQLCDFFIDRHSTATAALSVWNPLSNVHRWNTRCQRSCNNAMLFQLIHLWVMVWLDVHVVGNAALLLHLHLLDSSMPPMIRESFFLVRS